MGIGTLGGPQDRMAIAAAGRDYVRVGDRHVVQVVSDDRVAAPGEFAPERRALNLRQVQRAVGEQQLGHRGSVCATTSTSAGSGPTARILWLTDASKYALSPLPSSMVWSP